VLVSFFVVLYDCVCTRSYRFYDKFKSDWV
jgi:hypothetical protein